MRRGIRAPSIFRDFTSRLCWRGFRARAQRIGFDGTEAREPGAIWLYTDWVPPEGPHICTANLSLTMRAGAKQPAGLQFPLRRDAVAARDLSHKLAASGVTGDYIVVSPGGGWKSKCWPAERYGALCRELWQRHGIAAVINVGPGEDDLGSAVLQAAAPTTPLVFRPSLRELAALLAAARVVVAADTGPLHLAAALGTRVVALFGPTDPARNGPVPGGLVLRNVTYAGSTHGRSANYSPAMLSISVEQVADAVEQQWNIELNSERNNEPGSISNTESNSELKAQPNAESRSPSNTGSNGESRNQVNSKRSDRGS